MLAERVNGRGAPSVGKLETIIDSSSDPCPSDVVYVVNSKPTIITAGESTYVYYY